MLVAYKNLPFNFVFLFCIVQVASASAMLDSSKEVLYRIILRFTHSYLLFKTCGDLLIWEYMLLSSVYIFAKV